jgi:hypothetical protein
MSHGFDPRAQSVRGGALLVRCYVRVLSAGLSAAVSATTDMHLKQPDFWFRSRRHVCHGNRFRLLLLQASTTERAGGLRNGNIHRWTTAGGGRLLAAREIAWPWFASRPFRIPLPLTLRERRRATLILAPEFLVLFSQVVDLPLQLENQVSG